MRYPCPHCKKVLMIKDEYAGKTGKCPECGRRITLPEATDDPDTGVADAAAADGGDRLEADSARFLQADTPPGPTGRKRAVLLAAAVVLAVAGGAAYWYWTAPGRIPVPALSMYNVNADRYVQRSVSLDAEEIQRWQNALKEATGEYHTSKEVFFLLPNIDGLWREGGWDPEASSRYRERIATVPPHALRDWRTEIRRASAGMSGATLSDVLTRLVEVDRLFPEGRFAPAVSDRLLQRLREVPPEAAADMAEALEGEKGQAALTLALMDPLFRDGTFDAKRWEKKLRWIRNH